MRFNAEYRERATLKDGREVILRLLRPSDRGRIARGFSKLSPEGRYKRFLTGKPRLSSAELDYLTDVDQQTHVAIGAVLANQDGSEGEGVGIARYILSQKDENDGPSVVADTAIVVMDEAQGVGLGSLLFRRLADAACERGVTRFRGEVLATNEAMLALTRHLDADSEPVIHDGIAAVELKIAEESEAEPRPTSLLRAFAEGAAAIHEFLAWRRDE